MCKCQQGLCVDKELVQHRGFLMSFSLLANETCSYKPNHLGKSVRKYFLLVAMLNILFQAQCNMNLFSECFV